MCSMQRADRQLVQLQYCQGAAMILLVCKLQPELTLPLRSAGCTPSTLAALCWGMQHMEAQD